MLVRRACCFSATVCIHHYMYRTSPYLCVLRVLATNKKTTTTKIIASNLAMTSLTHCTLDPAGGTNRFRLIVAYFSVCLQIAHTHKKPSIHQYSYTVNYTCLLYAHVQNILLEYTYKHTHVRNFVARTSAAAMLCRSMF